MMSKKKPASQNLPSESYPASLVFFPLIPVSCDYSDHRARLHHMDSDQDSTYLREDRRHMLWGCQRTFLSTDHYQYINARLESVSGCSFRTRGISPHILPNLLLHISKTRLRETVSYEYRSLPVQRPSLHKIPSSFISSLQPLLRPSYHWQCPFCASLTGSPPSSVWYTDWTHPQIRTYQLSE